MAKELFNQALKTLLGLTDRISSAIPGQTGADNILYPDLREQIGDEIIPSAPEKTSLVDADEIGVSDSEDSNLLKAITWLNFKAVLKIYFDSLYSAIVLTTKGDLLTRNDTIQSRLPVGNDTQVLTADSSTDSGLAWSDAGGGGGHEYKENDIALTQRASRNIKTNGSKIVLVDDAANDETEENQYFEVALDVDPTGKQAGDVWGLNATNDKTEPQATGIYEGLYNAVPEANISADGILSLIIPAGYKIDNIAITEDSGNASGNISIGSTALGTDIVNAETVGANADIEANVLKGFFSRVNDTDLYISSSAWGSGIISIYITFKQI